MKIKLYKTQKNVFVVFFTLLSFSSLFAQVNNTKIKDGTISSSPEKAKPGALFELESNAKGMLTPRLTTAQRNEIPIANLTDGLLIFNVTSGCFDYWSQIQNIWLSLCGTLPPAVFEITTTQCGQIAHFGTYKQGQMLTAANYLQVPVTVTQPGVYTVSATTTNGYYFGSNGTFPTAGTYVLNLPGTGTPNNGYEVGDPGDPVNITLNGKASTCIPNIFVENANVDFTINCGIINPLGSYNIGIPLTQSNKLTVSVSPTVLGFWNIHTNIVNGYSFSGTGTFTDLTPNQTVELLGTGTPIASGINNFNIVSNATTPATASCTNVPVTVAPVAYTMNCATAIPNGVYMQDTPLNATNTITLPVNVTATGQTTITTSTANGITFSSGLINLSTLGSQNVTLNGSGTPTAAGTVALTATGTPGAVSTCSINLTIAAQPVSYTTNCSGITTAGEYAPNTPMTASNTMTIPVNVTYVGNYTISTNSLNGVSFSGSGTFASTGSQNVVLTASGTPLTTGSFTYNITANSTNGAQSCTKLITYLYRKVNVLGLGRNAYSPGTATTSQTARALLASKTNFGPTGTILVQDIGIFNGGESDTTLKSLINSNNIDIVVIGFAYTPSAASITVLNDFIKNKKGVVIVGQEGDSSGLASLINTVCGSTGVAASTTGTSYINPILNVSDPVLNGPFGNIQGTAGGGDNNSSNYLTNLPANVTSLATQDGNASRIWAFKHNTLGFMVCGDGGFIGGDSSNTSTTGYPAKISSTGVPLSKAFNGGVVVYNSIMYANTVAWAIKYVQENTNPAYVLP
nr:hypothetical protein [uncultured Flavobacterium sp.]